MIIFMQSSGSTAVKTDEEDKEHQPPYSKQSSNIHLTQHTKTSGKLTQSTLENARVFQARLYPPSYISPSQFPVFQLYLIKVLLFSPSWMSPSCVSAVFCNSSPCSKCPTLASFSRESKVERLSGVVSGCFDPLDFRAGMTHRTQMKHSMINNPKKTPMTIPAIAP